MKRTRDPHADHQLTQLANQFVHWRQHRTTRAEGLAAQRRGQTYH
jgi:hypothetical protein